MTNKKEEKLLPIGSIVLLEEGLQKLMIVGRETIYTDQQTGKDTVLLRSLKIKRALSELQIS